MFGSRWLRSMKGTPHKPNFATPSIPLLRLCVEPMSSTGLNHQLTQTISINEIKAELVIEMKKLIKISLNKFILCVCSFVTDIDTSLTFIEHIQFAVSCTYFNLETI